MSSYRYLSERGITPEWMGPTSSMSSGVLTPIGAPFLNSFATDALMQYLLCMVYPGLSFLDVTQQATAWKDYNKALALIACDMAVHRRTPNSPTRFTNMNPRGPLYHLLRTGLFGGGSIEWQGTARLSAALINRTFISEVGMGESVTQDVALAFVDSFRSSDVSPTAGHMTVLMTMQAQIPPMYRALVRELDMAKERIEVARFMTALSTTPGVMEMLSSR